MRKFVAGHVTKNWFLKYELLLSDTNFAIKLQGKCWKDDVVTFMAHLIVTIKYLTRYKQGMPSNMAAYTNHNTLLKNQSAIKYLPEMCFLSNFGCKIIFMCSVNFFQQQEFTTHCLSLVTWPLSASGLLHWLKIKLLQA